MIFEMGSVLKLCPIYAINDMSCTLRYLGIIFSKQMLEDASKASRYSEPFISHVGFCYFLHYVLSMKLYF